MRNNEADTYRAQIEECNDRILSTWGEIARNEAKRDEKRRIIAQIKQGNHAELATRLQVKERLEQRLQQVNEEIHNTTAELCQTHQQAHDRFSEAVDRGCEEVRNLEKELSNSEETLAEKQKLVNDIEEQKIEFTAFSSMCADVFGLNDNGTYTLAQVKDGLARFQSAFEETLQDVFEGEVNVLHKLFTSKRLTVRGWYKLMRFLKNSGLHKVLNLGVKTVKGSHYTEDNAIEDDTMEEFQYESVQKFLSGKLEENAYLLEELRVNAEQSRMFQNSKRVAEAPSPVTYATPKRGLKEMGLDVDSIVQKAKKRRAGNLHSDASHTIRASATPGGTESLPRPPSIFATPKKTVLSSTSATFGGMGVLQPSPIATPKKMSAEMENLPFPPSDIATPKKSKVDLENSTDVDNFSFASSLGAFGNLEEMGLSQGSDLGL